MIRKFVVLVFLMAAANASAEMTVRQYVADRDAANKSAFDRLVKPYLTGVGEGLMWANAQLKAQKSTPFFCDADEETLTTADYLKVVDDESKESYVQPEYPIELLLLKGLQKKFPCR
jgi:hypothetical protein